MAERAEIRATVFGATDVGQVREHNEDNLLVADLSARRRVGSGEILSVELGENGLLLAVADGMGGAASGELASEMAVDGVYAGFQEKGLREGEGDHDLLSTSVKECLVSANREIYEKSQAESEHRGMGTTMTSVLAMGEKLVIGQVGDSRAYLLRKGKLVQITKDQSLISQLIEDGTLTEEEADRLGGRNIILQALGVEADVTVDTKVMEILDGDLLLLCSDGLTGMVKDAGIESVLSTEEDLELACAKLVTMANDGGGKDNITAVLARFGGPGLRAPLKPLEREPGSGPVKGFVAPEIPDLERSRKGPLILGGFAVVMAVVLFLLLSGGGVDATFIYPVDARTVRLVPRAGGDPILLEPEPGQDRVTVSGLAPGVYTIEDAGLGEYERLVQPELQIFPKVTEYTLPIYEVSLLRIDPAGAPFASLEISIADAEEKSWRNRIRNTPVELGAGVDLSGLEPIEVPAGLLRVVIRKVGYQDGVQQVVAPAGVAPDPWTVPKLVPILGTLNLPCSVPGARVTAWNKFGEVILDGVEIPESGVLVTKLVVGRHTLEVTHENYLKNSIEVEIVKDEASGPDMLNLLPIPATLTVTAPSGSAFWVEQEGESKRKYRIPGSETTRSFRNLRPGKYRIWLDDKEEDAVNVELKARDDRKVELR